MFSQPLEATRHGGQRARLVCAHGGCVCVCARVHMLKVQSAQQLRNVRLRVNSSLLGRLIGL